MLYPCTPTVVPMTTPRAITPSSAEGMPDRHADNSGGPVFGGIGRTLGRFYDYITGTREMVNGNDENIQRDRTPWYDNDYMTSHHDTLVNWTDCGPVRPSLHMRQQTVTRMQGTSATRNFDPNPVVEGSGMQDQGHGMHTNPPLSKKAINANFRARQQQVPARVNRLSPAVYTGQSYSQTTSVQGG